MRRFARPALLLLLTATAATAAAAAAGSGGRFGGVGGRFGAVRQCRSPTTTGSTSSGGEDRRKKLLPSSVLTTTSARGGANTRGGASTAAVPLAAAKTMTAGRMKVFNLFSGGVAGTIAACITNPLEVVKTQLQSSSTSVAAHGELASASGHPLNVARRIFERDGVVGFWRGMRPTLIGIIPARSIYFFSYEQSKKALGRTGYLSEGSPGNALISGLCAGISSNTVTNPIWMVKTRMQLLADASAGQRAYTGYRDAVRSIAREEGVGGFYRGISASYWGCAEGAVQFMLYERFKSRLLEKRNLARAEAGLAPTDKLPKAMYFCSAAAAKAVAAVATYPHEVARTRMREQARGGLFKYSGMWQTIGLVAKEEGRRGLYAGMGVHLAKVVPNSAIMFLTYEVVNSWLGQFTVVDN